MSDLVVGTNLVLDNEPCLALTETHIQSPGSKGFRRYQIIRVIRSDRVAEFRKDLGPAKKFKGVEQIAIPGGVIDGKKIYIEHTVAELKDIADTIRGRPPFDKREIAKTNKIRIA